MKLLSLAMAGLFLALANSCNSPNSDQERQEENEKKDLIHKEYNKKAAENYNTYDD